MPSTQTHPPFEAYRGQEPFVFVSYAHKDSSTVFSELQRIASWGVPIWFDEGIDPGNEWTNEIAFAIKRSSLFLLFVSPHSIGSRNCRNEINFALSLDKPFVSIHLVETRVADIHPGTALSIESLQAIMMFHMAEASYERKLRKVLADFIKSSPEPIRPPALPPLPPPESNPLISARLSPLPQAGPLPSPPPIPPPSKLPPLPPVLPPVVSSSLPPLPPVLPIPNPRARTLPPIPTLSNLPPIPPVQPPSLPPNLPPLPPRLPTEPQEPEPHEPVLLESEEPSKAYEAADAQKESREETDKSN